VTRRFEFDELNSITIAMLLIAIATVGATGIGIGTAALSAQGEQQLLTNNKVDRAL
jgi:hypothetical protein